MVSVERSAFLRGIFRAAVEAADPERLVLEALRTEGGRCLFVPGKGAPPEEWPGGGRIVLVGGGKAAGAMGRAAVAALGDRLSSGVLAVPQGAGGMEGPVRLVEAAHPFPDEGSRRAAREMLSILRAAGEEDLVVALLSGGGSSMISLPAPGLSPEDEAAAVRLLMMSGADIAETNAVRKHLSSVKGGRLAMAAAPARVFALLLSDVPGDDPSVIASGPFSPDPVTFEEAREILKARGLTRKAPPSVSALLEAGMRGEAPETPKPGDPVFRRVSAGVIGSNATVLEAAAAAARRSGADPVRVLPGFLRGEARECARAFVAAMRQASRDRRPGRPLVVLAGGETTVTVRGAGRGGRNQELVLSAAVAMSGSADMAVLGAGTDGVDGPTDAAGAVADGATAAAGAALGFSPRVHLDGNDAYTFFRALNDLVVTGPTGTNVMDIAVGAVFPS